MQRVSLIEPSATSPLTAPICYTIAPKNLTAHLYEVTVTVQRPEREGQRFMLPTWIPGSYLIREFARNIVSVRARADGKPVAMTKIDKATWQCAPLHAPARVLTLTYNVYAWDLSVRGAHLDETHGFFNGTSVFLLPLGMRSQPCEIEILAHDEHPEWHIATSLSPMSYATTPASDANPRRARPDAASDGVERPVERRIGERKWNEMLGTEVRAFGKFYAANYDELIDHPVEIGNFTHAAFEACGSLHNVAITGVHRTDMNRLCADLKKICEYQIRFFEPESWRAPFPEYWFLITVVGDGFGGLEHRASTALIVNRDDLPLAHETPVTAGYRKLLSLASHEYFHSWNVKRIKPEAFIDYDLANENYTRQLWFFEGFTDYYDDLVLVRAGLITPLEYLEVEAENIGKVMAQNGRLKQNVAEASFDAWIKYYRQDENAPNALVSYYQKGAIVALALDLTIREKTKGAKSLDDVMRALWNEFGKTRVGVPEAAIEEIAARVTGLDLHDFFAHAVYGTNDLDLVPLMKHVGVAMTFQVPGVAGTDAKTPALGAKIGSEINSDARLVQVFDGGAAQLAGLSAGDSIIAIDGLRVTAMSLERRIKRYTVGTSIEVLACRRDEIKRFSLTLLAQPATTCSLITHDTPVEAKTRRSAWLQSPHFQSRN
jgi:predicted metalloprotease with PDZ domain